MQKIINFVFEFLPKDSFLFALAEDLFIDGHASALAITFIQPESGMAFEVNGRV